MAECGEGEGTYANKSISEGKSAKESSTAIVVSIANGWSMWETWGSLPACAESTCMLYEHRLEVPVGSRIIFILFNNDVSRWLLGGKGATESCKSARVTRDTRSCSGRTGQEVIEDRRGGSG